VPVLHATPPARCRHLGSRGARVALFDILEEKLKPAVESLAAKGIEATLHVLNVTTEADWARALEAVHEKWGRIDALVQAAGITGRTGVKTHEVDPANFDVRPSRPGSRRGPHHTLRNPTTHITTRTRRLSCR